MIDGAGLEAVEETYLLLLVRATPGCQNLCHDKVSMAQESSWLKSSRLWHIGGEHQLRKPRTLQ